jgi:DNA-directed RNA polymerase subunit RPC12/RpoP
MAEVEGHIVGSRNESLKGIHHESFSTSILHHPGIKRCFRPWQHTTVMTKPSLLSSGDLRSVPATGFRGVTRWAFGGFTGWTRTLLTVSMSPEGESGIRSIQRSRLPADMTFLPSRKKGKVSISCPDCQSDLAHKSRTRGIVEFLLVFLWFRPYRCEECAYRFFRRSVPHKPKATRSPRITNV